MAMIICKECSKNYSDLSNFCPNCGCPTAYNTHENTTHQNNHKVKHSKFIELAENFDESLKSLLSSIFDNKNYVLYILLALNILLVFINLDSELSKIMILIVLIYTGFMSGKFMLEMDGNLIIVIAFGILGMFKILNIPLLIFLVYKAVKISKKEFNEDEEYSKEDLYSREDRYLLYERIITMHEEQKKRKQIVENLQYQEGFGVEEALIVEAETEKIMNDFLIENHLSLDEYNRITEIIDIIE